MNMYVKGLIPLAVVMIVGIILTRFALDTFLSYVMLFESLLGLIFAVVFYVLFRYDEFNKYALIIGAGYGFGLVLSLFLWLLSGDLNGGTSDMIGIIAFVIGIILYVPKLVMVFANALLIKDAVEFGNHTAMGILIGSIVMVVLAIFLSPSLLTILQLQPYGFGGTLVFLIIVNSFYYLMITGTQALVDL